MCDYEESSQLKFWLYTPEQLEKCRARANRQGASFLAKPPTPDASAAEPEGDASSTVKPPPPVYNFAAGYAQNEEMDDDETASQPEKVVLTPKEEELLVAFYASKLPSLIGPMAQVPRLRRDDKVVATSALLFKRFFLSNSVMLHDPKAVMVAAAFLGTKVEDATADVRYLEEGTKLMNSPVTVAEILPAEVALLTGINFDLLCFHPYKAVLAFTQDLRTYLKTEKGRALYHFSDASARERQIVGQDLIPIHDGARKIINDIIVSDIPLLYSPGQVGLAALMMANNELSENSNVPRIDFLGYVEQRFDEKVDVRAKLTKLCSMLAGLREGKYGCGNHHVDMQALKAVHKKLKKCRYWGKSSGKSKKRKAGGGTDEPVSKKTKTT